MLQRSVELSEQLLSASYFTGRRPTFARAAPGVGTDASSHHHLHHHHSQMSSFFSESTSSSCASSNDRIVSTCRRGTIRRYPGRTSDPEYPPALSRSGPQQDHDHKVKTSFHSAESVLDMGPRALRRVSAEFKEKIAKLTAELTKLRGQGAKDAEHAAQLKALNRNIDQAFNTMGIGGGGASELRYAKPLASEDVVRNACDPLQKMATKYETGRELLDSLKMSLQELRKKMEDMETQ
ncbi:unnamed protein product [Amoebophrya sp. A25]|nr:unnamed protein product [Amoebophrya sp. A25]|eukprot:GSA25T00021842001.1